MTYRLGVKNKHCVFLDGSSDYLYNTGLNVTGVANLNPEGDEAFTVAAWIQDYETSVATRGFIFVKQSLYSPFDGIRLSIESSGQASFTFHTSVSGVRTGVDVVSGLGLQGGIKKGWNLLCGTYDGSETEAGYKIWLNGQDVSVTRTSVGTLANMSTGATATAHDLGVGAYSTSYSGDRYNGCLTSVSFWQAALNAAEIQELYYGNRGSMGPGNLLEHSQTSNLVSWWIGDPTDTTSTIVDMKGSNDLTGSSLATGALVPTNF